MFPAVGRDVRGSPLGLGVGKGVEVLSCIPAVGDGESGLTWELSWEGMVADRRV